MAKSTTENPAESGNETDAEVVAEYVPPAPEPEPAPAVERASIVNATHVKYVGSAHVAEITAAQWKQAGVEDGQGKVVWDRRKFRGDLVKLDELSPQALEYLDQFDSRFALVDSNGKRV